MRGLFGILSSGAKKGGKLYLNAGLSYGFGVIRTGFASFHYAEIDRGGLAEGYLGAQLEAGYHLGPRHLLSLAARVGRARSDTSVTPVVSWQLLLRYRYYFLTGLVRPYLGAEIGGGTVYLSALLESEGVTERDTFEIGPVALGAFLGLEIGTGRVRGYLDLSMDGLFPSQSTVAFGAALGVLVCL
jgi:hypothetical protein